MRVMGSHALTINYTDIINKEKKNIASYNNVMITRNSEGCDLVMGVTVVPVVPNY